MPDLCLIVTGCAPNRVTARVTMASAARRLWRETAARRKAPDCDAVREHRWFVRCRFAGASPTVRRGDGEPTEARRRASEAKALAAPGAIGLHSRGAAQFRCKPAQPHQLRRAVVRFNKPVWWGDALYKAGSGIARRRRQDLRIELAQSRRNERTFWHRSATIPNTAAHGASDLVWLTLGAGPPHRQQPGASWRS